MRERREEGEHWKVGTAARACPAGVASGSASDAACLAAALAQSQATPWGNLSGVDVEIVLVATKDSPLQAAGTAMVNVTVFPTGSSDSGASSSSSAAAATSAWTATANVSLVGSDASRPVLVRLSLPMSSSAGSGGGGGGNGDASSSPSPSLLRRWSPSDPFLYNVSVSLQQVLSGGSLFPLETVYSYFGLRSVALGTSPASSSRSSTTTSTAAGATTANSTVLLLNGDPVFISGPLDQGFWPSGIYTAPTDDALRFDLDAIKVRLYSILVGHVLCCASLCSRGESRFFL